MPFWPFKWSCYLFTTVQVICGQALATPQSINRCVDADDPHRDADADGYGDGRDHSDADDRAQGHRDGMWSWRESPSHGR